ELQGLELQKNLAVQRFGEARRGYQRRAHHVVPDARCGCTDAVEINIAHCLIHSCWGPGSSTRRLLFFGSGATSGTVSPSRHASARSLKCRDSGWPLWPGVMLKREASRSLRSNTARKPGPC